MSGLFRFSGAVERSPSVAAWMEQRTDELGTIARRWFEVMRNCGDEVREVLHDGHPTACFGDVAFAYVDAFTHHVNVGFFDGASLADPARLLEGSGRSMRHVKIRAGARIDEGALAALIEAAYEEMKERVEAG